MFLPISKIPQNGQWNWLENCGKGSAVNFEIFTIIGSHVNENERKLFTHQYYQ